MESSVRVNYRSVDEIRCGFTRVVVVLLMPILLICSFPDIVALM